MAKDLRESLKRLEAAGKLKRIIAEVDKDWEITCVARQVARLPSKERYGLMFEKIKGFDIPLVVGVTGGSRDIYAIALDVPFDQIHERWVEALTHPISPKQVKTGPCKENILIGDKVDLLKFPVPIWTPGKDPGPYITSGCVITKDIDTGVPNVGVYRLHVKTKNRLGILILPAKHIGIQYPMYEKAGKPMPVAVAIGPEPVVSMTAVARVPYGINEFAFAGGLQNEPIEMVKCETVDLEIPANSEIVIEGEIPPGEREIEGPFGEFSGFMGPEGMRPFINVKAITHRNQPIYHSFIEQMPPSEGSTVKDIALEVTLLRAFRALGIPGIVGVYVTEAGAQYHVVISMKKLYPGHVKQVFHACWSAYPVGCKQVVVVDDDCNIYDPIDVEWHVAICVQPARDIHIVDEVTGHGLDPSMPEERRAWGSKVGIDATRKHPYPPISLPPGEMLDQVKKNWAKYKLPKLQ